jgi:hypothetical protein
MSPQEESCIKIKNRDFALISHKSNTLKPRRKGVKYDNPALILVRFPKNIINIFSASFIRFKWRTLSSIFFGRGYYFKYFTSLPLIFIILFTLFTYSHTTSLDKKGNPLVVSKYDKDRPESEKTLYSSNNASVPQLKLDVVKYKVSKGETVKSVAEKFKDTKATPDTIKWANNLSEEHIEEGKVIEIPPIPGVLHTVEKDESAIDIAKRYKKISENPTPEEELAATQEITDVNL